MNAHPLQVLVAALALAGCDRDDRPIPGTHVPPSAAGRTTAEGAKRPGSKSENALELAETVDPAPPPGDLKSEVEHFTTLDACVAQHTAIDPLVGDGLLSIGYDNFLRDTCRLLEATQTKDARRCDPIEASALRARCQTFVAMATATPDRCPLDIPGDPSRGRDPSCVAIASRDPRLCAGEADPRRPQCEAMILRDEKRCASIVAGEGRRLCAREAARWTSMLAPATALPSLPKVTALVELKAREGSTDPPQAKADVSAAGGLTLVSPGMQAELHASASKLERARGGEARVLVEGTIGVAPHAYRIKVELSTFVRDVVSRSP